MGLHFQKAIQRVSHPGETAMNSALGPHHDLRTESKMLQTFNQDGSNGEPYANHLDGPTPSYFW
jgi:hypothetical protein